MARWLGIAKILILFCSSQASAQLNFRFFQPVEPPRNIQVMVHRGMAMAAPENSAAAIEMCVQDYCEWAEIDLRLTKDGRHVVIHNDTVDATTDGKGRIADLTLDELKKLDAGSWFAQRFSGNRLMTLSEALALAKGRINLYLDCKHIDAKLLVEEVIAAGMERQVIVYDSPEVLEKVKMVSHGAVPGMTKYRPMTMPFKAFVENVAPAAVEIDADEVTAELCQRFHAAGIKVQAKVLGEKWDNPEVWGPVIDAGIDWIQTDAPAGLLFFNARRRLGAVCGRRDRSAGVARPGLAGRRGDDQWGTVGRLTPKRLRPAGLRRGSSPLLLQQGGGSCRRPWQPALSPWAAARATPASNARARSRMPASPSRRARSGSFRSRAAAAPREP